MLFHAKPGAITGWLRLNPLNVIFYEQKLTTRGLAIRRRLLLALVVFVLALLPAAAVGVLTKLSS